VQEAEVQEVQEAQAIDILHIIEVKAEAAQTQAVYLTLKKKLLLQ